jgi:TrmH family RNA methyltransferase
MTDPSRISHVSSLSVILVSPRNPLNIGAAARAMSNFGFTDLRLVTPYEVAFREARSAVKSHYILESARVFSSVSEAIADSSQVIGTTAVGNRDLHVPLYPLEAASVFIREHIVTERVALLFGSEKFGLSNEALSFCHSALRIPTREEHGSMNLGQAVAICLYELRRSEERTALRFPPADKASVGDLERLTTLLTELLEQSGYINTRTAGSTILKIRRLIRRLGVPASDVETWLGMLRQISWKLGQKGP